MVSSLLLSQGLFRHYYIFDFVLSLSGRELAPVWIGLLTIKKRLSNVMKRATKCCQVLVCPSFIKNNVILTSIYSVKKMKYVGTHLSENE
jgi:hypothetical protein